ncbi:hypothetical protein GN156_06910 [bacterium LRH843]|nr:hypothetical protein [bacterium LRH843]
MKKKLFLFGSTMLCVLMLVGCGSKPSESVDGEIPVEEEEGAKKAAGETKSNQNLGDFNVYLGGAITETDENFVIEGESNLLPGARVIGEVWVGEEELFADSTELVDEDGTFHMEIDHHKYGEAEIVVKFQFEGVQDDAIKRHYGDKGQKLEGPYIYKHKEWDGVLKKAEVRVAYDPSEQSELVFTEPKWNELPEDYGDPRVWIEVDDLTEDGEFFYMHGRSNLLEGSTIKASYGNNRDETAVNPDGTFDFKIDYEYLEGKEFIIEFNPNNFQWNEIEEAYGEKGHKLIGNLVQTNPYNNNQYIEKHIPWDGNK